MILTSAQIREKFTDMWPDLEYIWLFDRKTWLCPPVEELQVILNNSRIPGMDWIDEFNDCDDFALQFLAEVRRKHYFAYKRGKISRENRIPKAVFLAFGNRFRNMDILHMVNPAICDDGNIHFIDSTPTAKRIWKADPDNDNPMFVSSV